MILSDFGTPEQGAYPRKISPTTLDHNRELGILVGGPEILERLHGVFEADGAK